MTVPGEFGSLSVEERYESAELSLEVIATSATTRRYTWTEAFDYTGPESVPEGLAAALLAAHQADGQSAEVTIALAPGAALPLPGDTRAGLAAQSVTADLKALTAVVTFGPPAPPGAADLAGFLTAFRNLRRSEIHSRRATGEAGKDAKDETIDFLPSTSSGFKKTADHRAVVAPPDGKAAAIIDPTRLPADKNVAEFREVTYAVKDGGGVAEKKAWFLVNEPQDKDDGDGEDGGGKGDPCSHPGGNGGVPITGGGGAGSVPVNTGGGGAPICKQGYGFN